jgi:hypothetical protein
MRSQISTRTLSSNLSFDVLPDRTKLLADDYLGVVGEMMYPKTRFGPYGHNPEEGRYPLNRITTLGYLLHPLRPVSVFEKWNPFEIAVFEGALTLYGKNFHQVQKLVCSLSAIKTMFSYSPELFFATQVQTKTVKEIIEFYYEWKKSKHYKEWKQTYVPDERDTPTVLVDG